MVLCGPCSFLKTLILLESQDTNEAGKSSDGSEDGSYENSVLAIADIK